ncbi:Gfo/Idh/MocA family protein [Pseudarthrobacter sp. P1]|uniref:Gfo/Idh/MocA family protein n=1 Tax=Pseudarthrobacter sp. P1 TaxID=3418418 RepID=UPI003CEFF4CF
MSEVRYGLVGAGYFGLAIGRALLKLPSASISYVFDPHNSAKAALDLGAREASSIEELCSSDDVDAVIVASPNWAHAEAVLVAARHGKHVFCEKPIALSYADCTRMIAATSDADVVFMAGHAMNFMSGVRRAKALLVDGAIGDVVFTRAVRNNWEGAQGDVTWKKRRDLSGGHLYHHIHELDFVQSIMGPAVEVTMAGGNVAHQGPEFGDEDDLLLMTLEFGNNTFAALEYGSAFRWPEHYVLIEGTKGAIRIDLQDTGVELRAPESTETFLLHRTVDEDDDRTAFYNRGAVDGGVLFGNPTIEPPLWLRGVIEEELTYFHGLMRGELAIAEFAALIDGTAAAASIATADALSLSLQEGRKVLVSEITG